MASSSGASCRARDVQQSKRFSCMRRRQTARPESSGRQALAGNSAGGYKCETLGRMQASQSTDLIELQSVMHQTSMPQDAPGHPSHPLAADDGEPPGPNKAKSSQVF